MRVPSHSTGERGTMDGDCGLSFRKLCLGVSALLGLISPYACAGKVSLLDTHNLSIYSGMGTNPGSPMRSTPSKVGVVHAVCVPNPLPNPTIYLLATALRCGCPKNPRE